MSKFAPYNIYLKNLTERRQEFDFDLNDEFFKKIDSPEIEYGNVKAKIEARRKNYSFELKISLNGYITIFCDRCLDDMQQPITHNEILTVKFGEAFGEEGEMLIVPETDGYINLAWFFYEMIVVNIPIKHIHASGECNKMMQQHLKKYSVSLLNDEETVNSDFDDENSDSNCGNEIDPRWEKLKDIKIINK